MNKKLLIVGCSFIFIIILLMFSGQIIKQNEIVNCTNVTMKILVLRNLTIKCNFDENICYPYSDVLIPPMFVLVDGYIENETIKYFSFSYETIQNKTVNLCHNQTHEWEFVKWKTVCIINRGCEPRGIDGYRLNVTRYKK